MEMILIFLDLTGSLIFLLNYDDYKKFDWMIYELFNYLLSLEVIYLIILMYFCLLFKIYWNFGIY